jgi:RNA polymerase-interacting CarD/CdnL/TRCF family regulator
MATRYQDLESISRARVSSDVLPWYTEVMVANETEKELQTLTVGSRVFYPSHGVAFVSGKEEREFGGGQKQVFYTLELDRGVKLMVPLHKVEQAGFRALISAEKARELLELARTDPESEVKLDFASRKKRYALYAEGLKSGSADQYTEILQELLFRSRSGKLSSSEHQTLDTARAYFMGEVGAALDLSAEQIEEQLLSDTAS